MDFLCVGKTKLKITLSKAECEEFNIDPTVSEPKDRDLRRTLRKLLSVAEERCAFRTDGEKLLVQFYPLSDGGCELFVTKISSIGERERRAIVESDSLSTYQDVECVYLFENFDALLSAIKTIDRPHAYCDVFYADSGEYYIRLKEHNVNGMSEFYQLVEFGTRLNSLPLGICGEWGREIIRGDGIAILSKL